VDDGSLTDLGVLRAPMRAERGAFMPPATPGHGVQFDWDALRRWAVSPGAVVTAEPMSRSTPT
jgi:L-alanine-DL-glutamate epimerase-like enolase superfamily enzyme